MITIEFIPYAVNAGNAAYPDIEKFVGFLKENIRKVIYITEDLGTMKPVVRNLYVFGKLSEEKTFPISHRYLIKAIENIVKPDFLALSLEAFKAGRKSKELIEEN